MFNVDEIRKDFPMLRGLLNEEKPLVYLDNGATTFKPQCVIDAVNNYYCNMTANAHRGDYQLAMKVDEAFEHTRDLVAKFINCASKEVIFTSGASAALNLCAYGYGKKFLKAGDVILLTWAEHASNVLPWFTIAAETGAIIEYIELDDQGRLTIENVKKALHSKVKIVSIAAVTNVLGYLADVKEIARLAHQVGAKVIVDGAQSVPHNVTDVKNWDCDFLAFSAHKMCGPTGVGVLYGKYELLEEMDPYLIGGGSNARFDTCGNIKLKNPPYKFEAGTQSIEGVIGFGAAIEYLMKIGMENIHLYEKELQVYLESELKKLDNVILYNPGADSAIASFNVKKIFSQDGAAYLSTQGVCLRAGNHCAKLLVEFLQTSSTLRASLYFHNKKEDVDALVQALKTTTIENCVSTIF